MNHFKKQKEEIIAEIEDSQNQISVLKEDLVQVRQDKLFYKRKEGTPNLFKTLEVKIGMVNRIR